MSRCYPGHAWLAAAIPLEARRFRVLEPGIGVHPRRTRAPSSSMSFQTSRSLLWGQLRGDAGNIAIVSIDAPTPDVDSRFRRAARRLAGSLKVRAEAKAAKASVRRLGVHRRVRSQLGPCPGLRRPRATRPWTWRCGRTTAPTCRGGGPKVLEERVTALGASIADASRQAGTSIHFNAPSMREAVLVAVGDSGVLRIAVGPARNQLEQQAAALEELRSNRAAVVLSLCISWPIAAGTIRPRALGARATSRRYAAGADSSGACAGRLPRFPGRAARLRSPRLPEAHSDRRREARSCGLRRRAQQCGHARRAAAYGRSG